MPDGRSRALKFGICSLPALALIASAPGATQDDARPSVSDAINFITQMCTGSVERRGRHYSSVEDTSRITIVSTGSDHSLFVWQSTRLEALNEREAGQIYRHSIRAEAKFSQLSTNSINAPGTNDIVSRDFGGLRIDCNDMSSNKCLHVSELSGIPREGWNERNSGPQQMFWLNCKHPDRVQNAVRIIAEASQPEASNDPFDY